MTRLREFMKDRPIITAFVATAIVAGAAGALHGPVDRALRMLDNELVTASQGARIEDRADKALADMKAFVDGINGAVRYEDVADFRMKLQSVSVELHSVHYPQEKGKKARQADPLAVLAGQLQAKGIVLGNAVAMLAVWENEARAGNTERADAAREIMRDILVRKNPGIPDILEVPDGTPRSVFYRS